jgi:hypothetical protein
MSRIRRTEIAKLLGWNIKVKMEVCVPCAETKAKKKKITSSTEKQSILDVFIWISTH